MGGPWERGLGASRQPALHLRPGTGRRRLLVPFPSTPGLLACISLSHRGSKLVGSREAPGTGPGGNDRCRCRGSRTVSPCLLDISKYAYFYYIKSPQVAFGSWSQIQQLG